MGVSAEDRRVLHETLPLVLERMRPVSERFYDSLFVLEPEMRALFEAHLGGRGMRFVGTLTSIVALVEDEATLERSAAALGRAHLGYGVRPQH